MKWKLIPSTKVPAQGQMALDAELFKGFQSDGTPILRFFYFSQPTFTLGRLEAKRFHLASLPHPYEVRPTGGRAVLHGEMDLCYALLASQGDALVGGTLMESYCKISKILAQGIQSFGRDVRLSTQKHLSAEDPHCFASPSQAELTWRGKKVAGGAQARERDIFLQQGVILLSVHQDWEKVFLAASVENMGGLNDDPMLTPISRDQLETALVLTFEKAGVSFEKP